jgi:hypothetical protein
MNLPEAADPLFELPPEEFTAQRDHLARALKKQGDEDGASAVKALKKPNATAYALNLVSRRHSELVEDLLQADSKLRSARSRGEMDAAKGERQKAIASITARATTLLEEQERSITAQVRERLTETLLAVATDDATRELLKAGRLVKEAEAGGFGGPVAVFDERPEDDRQRKLKERVSKIRAEAEAKLAEAKKAKADSERALHESKELAEASAAAKDRAGKLANIAEKAEALGKAKMAEAEELESRSR